MIAEALFCLALNAYWEARDQDMKGMLAVSQVVMNRVESEYYPDTACEVVYQGPTKPSWKDPSVSYPVKNRCQFSWYCDGKGDKPKDIKTYNKLLDISYAILDKQMPFIDLTDGALFYHADYVTPGWAKTKIKTVEIQDHIFYRWETK